MSEVSVSLQVGLAGFSQGGKSSLFEALTSIPPDSSSGLDGQVGIAPVSDPRLDFLSNLFKPEKTTYATCSFVDTPGLDPADSKNNPRRIATLRNADGLAIVVDRFQSQKPALAQVKAFREELAFADLIVTTARIERIQNTLKKIKGGPQLEKQKAELSLFETLNRQLEAGKPLSELGLSKEVCTMLRGFQLFSMKPELIIVNCSETAFESEPEKSELHSLSRNVIWLSATLERDLVRLDDKSRPAFMAELGITESARNRLIKMAYDAIGLMSFFTVGEDECKAWTIRNGSSAVEAADVIHSDIARGFIRAEVVAYDDYARLGSMKEVKAHGLQRLEGKDYIVQNGDIINFRFYV